MSGFNKKKRVYRRKRYRPYRPRSEWSRWGSWARKGTNLYEMANAALTGVEKIKGLVNSELFKYDQTFTAATQITNSGTVASLTAIANGDGQGARTGNSIFVRSFNLKGRLQYTTGGNSQQTIRISVVMDKQQVGDTSPSYSDIYSNPAPWSHLNPATVGRFKVLWTRTFVVDPVGKTGLPFQINIPMRHHVRYNGTSGTDIQRGGLFLTYISDQGTSNYPIIDAEYRLSYHDN